VSQLHEVSVTVSSSASSLYTLPAKGLSVSTYFTSGVEILPSVTEIYETVIETFEFFLPTDIKFSGNGAL
jgi:hypothetical protein